MYGGCTGPRAFLEGRGQAYVLRVASNFTTGDAATRHVLAGSIAVPASTEQMSWSARKWRLP
ncbi:hypothetical protein DI270_017550 [Microbispora triticiradicis]|uniref:Uncharacterized protein n=1 Tax=Microbispora triticiradicis TaxID=2200763 RepID=A0ABX9LJ81_9ACTN|nr:hypothetical protein DI270_017550 [Microbispora triticiradicis]